MNFNPATMCFMNSYFKNAGDLELYRTSLDIHRKETLDTIFHTWRKNSPEWKRFFPIRESYLGRMALVKNKNLREQLELKEKYEIIEVLRDGEGHGHREETRHRRREEEELGVQASEPGQKPWVHRRSSGGAGVGMSRL